MSGAAADTVAFTVGVVALLLVISVGVLMAATVSQRNARRAARAERRGSEQAGHHGLHIRLRHG